MVGFEETVALTDVGRTREHNEDSHLVLPSCGLLAVADGMGGLDMGEVASATAVATLKAAESALKNIAEGLDGEPGRNRRAQLAQALELVSNLASQRIVQAVQGARSGTTLVLAAAAGGRLLVANTGDSRAYLFRQGKLRRLTEDHTVAAARLRAGLITEAEHDSSPYQHMLYQALGTQPEVDPDIFDEPLAAGDIVLVCSDGLTGPVKEAEVEKILKKHKSLSKAARALIDRANDNGGPDNITVVLGRVGQGGVADVVEKERLEAMGHPIFKFLDEVDRRLLLHYFEPVASAAGGSLDGEGAIVLLEGDVGGAVAPAVIGLPRLVMDTPSILPPVPTPTACKGLLFTSDAYEALERRRPAVAARLMRGLLRSAVG